MEFVKGLDMVITVTDRKGCHRSAGNSGVQSDGCYLHFKFACTQRCLPQDSIKYSINQDWGGVRHKGLDEINERYQSGNEILCVVNISVWVRGCTQVREMKTQKHTETHGCRDSVSVNRSGFPLPPSTFTFSYIYTLAKRFPYLKTN